MLDDVGTEHPTPYRKPLFFTVSILLFHSWQPGKTGILYAA
nr:MAG TPA: hypothetical protein [Caudoviricetes sp.]